MRDIVYSWYKEGKKLQEGDELYIPCEGKKLKMSLYSDLKTLSEKERGKEVLVISHKYKDKTHWVTIKREIRSNSTAWVKKKNGKIEKLSMKRSLEREKILKCMTQDGLNVEEMNNLLDTPLTEEEKKEMEKLK